MKKLEYLNTISLVTALSAALVLALTATAGAQSMDPVLDQYAPSNQQIDKNVNGDKGSDNGSGGSEGDSQSGQAGAVAGSGQGADGDTNDGSGNGAGGAGGGSGGGGSGGWAAASVAPRAGVLPERTRAERARAREIPASTHVFSPTCPSRGSISSPSRLPPAL